MTQPTVEHAPDLFGKPPGAGPRFCILSGAVATAFLAAALTSFHLRSSAAPISILGAVDVSGSHDPLLRKRDCAALQQVARATLGPRSEVSLWAFDRHAWKAFRQQIIDDSHLRKDLEAVFLAKLRARPEGTSPAEALGKIVVEARDKNARHERIVVVLFWDGEDYDRATTRALLAELAKLPNVVAVWIAGIDVNPPADFMAPVEDALAPFPPERKVISDRNSMVAGLREFAFKVRRNSR